MTNWGLKKMGVGGIWSISLPVVPERLFFSPGTSTNQILKFGIIVHQQDRPAAASFLWSSSRCWIHAFHTSSVTLLVTHLEPVKQKLNFSHSVKPVRCRGSRIQRESLSLTAFSWQAIKKQIWLLPKRLTKRILYTHFCYLFRKQEKETHEAVNRALRVGIKSGRDRTFRLSVVCRRKRRRVQFAQLHRAFTTNMSELKALYSLLGLHDDVDRVLASAQSCV